MDATASNQMSGDVEYMSEVTMLLLIGSWQMKLWVWDEGAEGAGMGMPKLL